MKKYSNEQRKKESKEMIKYYIKITTMLWQKKESKKCYITMI